MKFSSKRIVLVCLLFASILAWGQDSEPESLYESLDMSVVFDRTYMETFPTLYATPDIVLLPFAQLFDFLKIPNTVSNDGQVIKGFFEVESNRFEVDYTKKTVWYKGNSFPFTDDEAVLDIGMFYLRTTVFKRVFGFDMAFNARALSIQFTSPFELPLFKLIKLEKKREMLRLEGSEEAVYDTTYGRDYHWFRGHMVDWSVASSQSTDGATDTRFALGYGTEFLGGETNLSLNYSTTSGFSRNQQQYSWRWADNKAKLIRQVKLGRINTQSIASVLSPVDGFMVTNALTTIRKTLGSYLIEDHTEPDWVVELYMNNQLISYTRADASGYYSFKVPIVYGTSNMVLRFYGPNGEIRSEERKFSMPFNLLPKGELEYQVSGGALLDTLGAKFGRAQLNYGVNRMLTLGAGVEYLTSIATHPEVPFLNFTFQPYSKLLLTGEYAHNVRTKATLNYSLPGNVVLDGTYARYVPGQEAIIYNYLEERAISLSIPFRYRNLTSGVRASIRQNIYPDFAYTSGEATWTNTYKNYSLIYTNYVNYSEANVDNSQNAPNVYGNLTFGTKYKNLGIRASAQYNYGFKQLISLRAELDRKVFNHGYASLKLENNFLSGSKSVNLAFRYELPFMMTNASTTVSNKSIQISEGASGSFAFNSGGKYVRVDNRGAVGRSGISLIPFVDVNFNGKRDANEPFSKGLRVRCSGGQVLNAENDSIIRIVGLEPFVDYNLILDESGFDNVSLRSSVKNMKVVTDPNQFKWILLPILPMAEMYGSVVDENGNGIGRIIVRVTDKNDSLIAKVLTESDGYFNYIGFKPGDYKVFVDSLQLSILKYQATPVYGTVLENAEGDVVDVGTIQLVKKRIAQTRKVRRALPDGTFEEVEVPIEEEVIEQVVPEVVPQVAIEEDTLALFSILFSVNKTDVRPEYYEPLQQLAKYLNKPEHEQLGIDIQGHTDSDASDVYNLLLSNRRANAVKQVLVHYGVRPERLKTSAFGKTRMLNENKSTLDKSRNRRVIFRPIKVDEAAERPIEEAIGLRNAEYLKPLSEVIRVDTETTRQLASKESVMERYPGTPTWCLMFQYQGKFMFQVAAFRNQEQAMKLAEKLRDFRPDKVMIVNQGEYVKVQLGFYENPEEALHEAQILRATGYIK
jgi:outer membrane protein OmpA-like peptidoglycan-associated protein